MRAFQMAGEEKMDDWGRIGPGCVLGLNLEWVRGIGETAGGANFHTLQDRPTSLFICPPEHMRKTKNSPDTR
jgi:hypothetical protein